MIRRSGLLVLAVALSTSLALYHAVQLRGGSASTRVGQKVTGFSLKDTRGHTVSLDEFKGKKAVVVFFLGTECPINNSFMPTVAELHRQYAPKGVEFLGINSNQLDTAQRVKEHARKYGIPFPVLKDQGNVVADQFGARRTPEAFVLDQAGEIRYQGRIDDQFGIGYKRAKPTRRDLALAIDEVLAGRAVSQATTEVAGCIVARAAKAESEGSVTYAKEVSRILQAKCQECHRPGQIGPMSLLSYDDATAWAETIKEVIQEGRMPPWYADPHYGSFSNDRHLSSEDKATLLTWIEQGMPKGDEKDSPSPARFPEGWSIGKPDVVISMNQEFDVPADMPKGGVPYKDFFVDTGFKEDRWVVGAECKPGAPEVVHHIIVYVVPPGKKFFPGNPETPTLAGTAPGDMPLMVPAGTGKKIPAGSQLVFQMHYTPNGRAQKDRSSVGFIFAKEPPQREVITLPIANPAFEIPAGDANYEVESEFPFRQDAHLLSFMPHMHVRGKDFKYELVYPDGKTETLLSVPRFNFNWQSVYRVAKPLPLPKGSKLHCVAHFDNSAKNPNNPDATQPVIWGEQTWEEMMIGWIDVVFDRPAQ
jgi:peroxiredoxin